MVGMVVTISPNLTIIGFVIELPLIYKVQLFFHSHPNQASLYDNPKYIITCCTQTAVLNSFDNNWEMGFMLLGMKRCGFRFRVQFKVRL